MLRALTITVASLAIALIGATAALPRAAYAEGEVVIDAIVASVNGVPITLQEVLARLIPRRSMTLKEAASNPEARAALEALIVEQLILADAAAKHIGVSDAEITSYVDEVARRNQLTRADFEAALARDGRNLEEYSRRIKIDILRSKIIGQYIQGSVSVSQEEIDRYLEEHPRLKQAGPKLGLSQILVATTASPEEAQKKVADIQARIAKGEDFAALARELSEGAEAPEGGSLGLLAEQDLGSQVFDAVFPLTPGQVSAPVITESGIHLFRLDSRHGEAGESSQNLGTEEAKAEIRQQKVNERIYTYFTSELPKLYSVEKKI